MPTVTVKNEVSRVPLSGHTDDGWRSPVKKILAASTGMEIEKTPPQEQENRQLGTTVDTRSQAVTLSPQLTALARKEAKIRQQEQSIKAREDAINAKEAEIGSLSSFKERLSKKDFAALDEQGISYEEWTNYLLSKGDSEKPEIQAIQKLTDEVQGLKASQEAQINKQYEATVGQYRTDIKNLVEKDPEFATVKELKKEEYVLQHILETFETDGEVLTVEQAAKEIEDALVEDALTYTSLSKVKAKLPPPQEKKLPPPKTGLRTLTNEMTTTAGNKYPQMQHLSMKERLELAVKKAQRT